jgi:hypothetical protein
MPPKLRPHLTYANVVSTVCLFVVLGGSAVAATVITGKDVKNSSLTGKDVKNSSLTGKDVKNSSLTGADLRAESVNSDDVADGSLLGQDFAPGQLPQGPKGDTGPKGDKGDPGTDASINGVAAGGDLAGTFPNPSIADGKVTTAKLADGIQEATIMNVARGQYFDNNAGAVGPLTGPIRLLINCGVSNQGPRPTQGMAIFLQTFEGGDFQVHTFYVRGTNTANRTDDVFNSVPSELSFALVDTAVDVGGTGNDSGTGSFIAHTPNATVSGTFSYLADATHCELLASMELMQ